MILNQSIENSDEAESIRNSGNWKTEPLANKGNNTLYCIVL
jgi:hypothetical protein